MSDSIKEVAIAAVLGFSLAALIACFVLLGVTNSHKADAIQHGVAEYYIDVDNNRQFRWKECGK